MTDRAAHELYRGRRVAVLGATGFIGAWLARRLCACGAEPHLFLRDSVRAKRVFASHGIEGHRVELNLRDTQALREALHRIRPAITFNLAGYGVDRSEVDEAVGDRLNAQLVQTIAAALADARDPSWPGRALVHVGSALEYGTIGNDLDEESDPLPDTPYGRTKLRGTLLLREACTRTGLPAATARLFTVYGPGEHPHRLLPALLETARSGEPLRLTAGHQHRDFTYVEDVAEGLLRLGAAATGPGEVLNLATGRLQSVREFARIAARVLGIPDERLRFDELPTRPEEMRHAPVAIERLRSRLGWAPTTTIEEGIRRTWRFAVGADTREK